MNPFSYTENKHDKIQYTTVERIIEMIGRDYKFLPKINVSDILEWVGAIYGTVDVPEMFRSKITGQDELTPNVKIVGKRGELPIDFRKVQKAGVRDFDSKIVYKGSTGTFTSDTNEKIYSIRGGYIFIDNDKATLEIAYEAFPIDERGFPLIPDNERVLQYAKNYIATMVAFNLVAEGKLDRYIFETIEKRSYFGAGSAQTALITPTPDQMESWTWSRVRLLPNITAFETSFANISSLDHK